ncbi:MAG: type VI secretion system tip protein TssI/VgrG [Polyangiales bacterium]
MSDIFSLTSGALPPDVRVAAFDGAERMSTAYAITLWLLVPHEDALGVDPDAVLLQPATLQVSHADGSPRWTLSGVFTEVELVHDEPGGDSLYRCVLSPTWAKLRLSRHSRVWVDKTTPFILEDVLRKAGYPADRYALRLNRRYTPRAHVCQYRESDFDFLSRWMEREGIYYFFEQTDAGERMVITDDRASHEPFGAGVARFVTETGDGDSGHEGFRAFTARERYLRKEVRAVDHDPLRPRAHFRGAADVQPPHDGVEVRYAEDGATSQALTDRAASLRAGEELTRAHTGHGSGRVFDVRVGYTFTLEEHPRVSLNQEYLCVAVTHRGRLVGASSAWGEYIPGLGPREYVAEVEVVRHEGQYRPPRVTPAARAPNLEIARVDGPVDSDYAQLDEHGRYRVRMHFDENDTQPGESSTLVRMIQPHAGAPEGWHLPLRKGTEVMIAFLTGDPDRPVIVGAVPDADHPSTVTSANATQNVFHTGGDSRFEFEDTAGAQYIDISTPPERTFLHLGAHHGGHRHNYISSTDGNGLIHTGGTLDVTVGGNKHEHVRGTLRETYESTQTTEVTGDVTETYDANMATTVTGHVQENDRSHETIVTNTTVESCASQRTEVSGHLEEKHGEKHTTVGGRLYVRSANHTEDTTGAHTGEFGTLLITVTGTFTLTSAGPIRINALNWQDNAPIQYTIVTNVRNVIHNASKAVVYPLMIEAVGNKTSLGTFALSLGNVKAELNGFVLAKQAFKFDYTGGKTERIGIKVKPWPIDLGKKPIKGNTYSFSLLG